MSSESQVIIEIWDAIRDVISASHRQDAAIAIVRTYNEHGCDKEDLGDLLDEDSYLAKAHKEVFFDDESYEDEDEE